MHEHTHYRQFLCGLEPSCELSWAVSVVRAARAKLPKVKGTFDVHGCKLSDKILQDKRQRYPGDSVG